MTQYLPPDAQATGQPSAGRRHSWRVRHGDGLRRLTWLGWILVLAPIAAFALLGILHPIGDPQDSGSLLVRFLDYQGTYWMRHALPLPPPLLLAGTLLLSLIWLRRHIRSARAGAVAGLLLLGLWSLVMLVPLLLHVN